MMSFITILTLLALLALLAPAVAEGEPSIEADTPCNQRLSVDRALIKFATSPAEGEVNGGVQLEATNSYCYRCAKTVIASGDGSCAVLFSPHEWTLYAVNNVTMEVLAAKDYTFGEHGEYTVTYTQAEGLLVSEDKSPIDSYTPLYVVAGLVVALAVATFAVPTYRVVQEYRSRPVEDSDPRLSYRSNTSSNQPLLRDSEIKGDRTRDGAEVEAVAAAAKKSARVMSLDTFRGFTLFFMIFVNYGGGSYWFFEHADWHGLTVADVLFPWFMWMMGVSMALSFEAMRKRGVTKRELWKKVIIRSLKLFGIGMFLANGYELSTWRIPGVLQYFSVSYFVTCATVLSLDSYTNDHLKRIKEKEKDFYDSINNWAVHPEDRFMGGLCYPPPSLTLFAYRYEWIVQGLLILVYVLITFVGKAPGCPRGYIGAGGIEQNGDYAECTGGIHRYIDIQLFTYDLIYHFPTCKSLYQCQAYDPEGFVGVISACTLTYLGLMAGRCVVQFDNHKSRLNRWLCWAVVLLLLAGGLCGFSKNEGVMPINKNLWTTSFVFVTAGGGLIMLSITYVIVDVLKIWDGAPFRYMGMNSILIYIGHDILGGFFPFSYQTDSTSHARQLQMNLIGVCCWAVLGYYFYRIKFFLKV